MGLEEGKLVREDSIEEAKLELGLGRWWPFTGSTGKGEELDVPHRRALGPEA